MTQPDALEQLRASAFALEGQPDRLVVPEPAVKAWLASHGVAVPRSGSPAELAEPLVLKAFGPGIVHKSDIGAVRLGVTQAGADEAVAAMKATLATHGITASEPLFEETAPSGVEVIVGVIDHAVFGPMLMVGMGGTLAEVMGDVTLRPLPVSDDEIGEMLDELRGAPILRGARGKAGVDRAALVSVVSGVAAAAGELGGSLAELECNPVIASPHGAVAADARLILRAAPKPERLARPTTDFARLFNPRGVAIAGASATKSSFGNWILEAMREMGREQLVALHPSADTIEGVPAYPSVDDVPHDIDYVLAAVPAKACADLIASAKRAEFVHVISGGFREAGEGGQSLEQGLVDAAVGAEVRVLGPNCMGTFSPAGRLTFQLNAPTAVGNVSVISQSGGLAGDLVKLGDARGVRFSKIVTVGNAVDVTHAELLDWMIDDPDTKVIGLYVEDPRDGAGLVRALRRSRGVKPVVALVGGLSPQGARAVASHTGALAADTAVWAGISKATGVRLAQSFEDFIGALRFLQRYADGPVATQHDVLIAGVGGGATVLAADACDRAGLKIELLSTEGQQVLRSHGYGVGTSIVNPIEIPIGPGVAPDLLANLLDEVLSVQPYSDVLVHMNLQQYFSFVQGGHERLVPFAEAMGAAGWRGARLALVVRNVECAPAAVREQLEAAFVRYDVATFPNMQEAAVAIAAAQAFDRERARVTAR